VQGLIIAMHVGRGDHPLPESVEITDRRLLIIRQRDHRAQNHARAPTSPLIVSMLGSTSTKIERFMNSPG
jgi:hypothetical protein